MMVPDNWVHYLNLVLGKSLTSTRGLPDYMAQLFNVETSSKARNKPRRRFSRDNGRVGKDK